MQLYTLGHSNLSFQNFTEVLRTFEIKQVGDIRRIPASGRFPHFTYKPFKVSLEAHETRYRHFEHLGGKLSHSDENTANLGLKDIQLRAYADYMMTEEFQEEVDQLLEWAKSGRTVLLCAERVYTDCHRRLLCDYLVAKGHEIIHIENANNSYPHEITPTAQIEEKFVTYPKPAELF